MSQFELDGYDDDQSQTSHNYIPKTQIKDVLRSLNVSYSNFADRKFSYVKDSSLSKIWTSWNMGTPCPKLKTKKAVFWWAGSVKVTFYHLKVVFHSWSAHQHTNKCPKLLALLGATSKTWWPRFGNKSSKTTYTRKSRTKKSNISRKSRSLSAWSSKPNLKKLNWPSLSRPRNRIFSFNKLNKSKSTRPYWETSVTNTLKVKCQCSRRNWIYISPSFPNITWSWLRKPTLSSKRNLTSTSPWKNTSRSKSSKSCRNICKIYRMLKPRAKRFSISSINTRTKPRREILRFQGYVHNWRKSERMLRGESVLYPDAI